MTTQVDLDDATKTFIADAARKHVVKRTAMEQYAIRWDMRDDRTQAQADALGTYVFVINMRRRCREFPINNDYAIETFETFYDLVQGE